MNNDLNSYRRIAGLTPESKDTLTEAMLHQAKAKKKKVKKANLTEKDMDAKKAKACAVRDIAKGNKHATSAGKMKKKVMKEATEHFGDRRIARHITEAIMWKKLAKVDAAITEQELTSYFSEFDALLETVVDTKAGAKSLHGQYDSKLDGNVYKDSESEAAKAGKAPATKKDDKWKNANEKTTDENVKKVTEDSEGAKKDDAGDVAKTSIAKGSHGTKNESVDLDFFRKVAGIDAEKDQTETLYVITEAATGKIECMFPKYEEASKWLDRMKKAAGTYSIDPKTFSRGFHKKLDTNGGYSTEAK